MIGFDEIRKLSQITPSKIVLLVMDGVGGLPHPATGKTELEAAQCPNLDRLAAESICGMHYTVSPGITPGSAPGHMSLFGYDPLSYPLGRGIVEALGLDIEVAPGDVVARGNFCTVDKTGRISDRRAGRLASDKSSELCSLLNTRVKLNNCQLEFFPGKEHRFVVRFRGDGLSDEVSDTDPQHEGMLPIQAQALDPAANKTAGLVNALVEKSRTLLEDQSPANMFLLRGFSQHPDYPSLHNIYQVTPACIATYPMYRGVSRVVGMDILPAGENLQTQLEVLRKNYDSYDYFFIHFKKTDARGEDGDFDAKVKAVEELDAALPGFLELHPDVFIVTGDHSTPAGIAGHSWHTIPVMLRAQYCRKDEVTEFSERACLHGGLGQFHATELMPLAMANALKLNKFGA
ncbi:MAG: 2,3-bisphosphoglycerate-independent phosphoglycerate mutase [Dehalococcoidia bacterium]|nr:2,3-bisphosphoglycerate-independent phosphoglycerate mutase [Dehalococcoidia bacterium]